MYSIRVTDIVGGYTYKVLEPYDQDTYPVVSATLDEAVNAAMTLTFTIPSSHPNLADIKAAETTGGILVEAFRDGTQIFNGRVYKRTIDKMTGMHTFVCESMFSRLNDSIVKPYHFAGTPAAYFQALFDNASMGSYVGTVTVTDPNNYIVRSNEEPSVLWDEIADKCIGSSLGGFIECDANASQFSWLATPSASGTQKIRVAHNLLSCEDDFDVSERFTGVYVYGAELGTENEYGQKQYLDFNGVDISSELPSGFTQLYHSSVIWKDSLVAQFGMIYKLAHFENVTTQSALISRAVSMLNNQANITELRISAIDMSDIDGETDAITAGQTVEIVAPDGTISAMCTQISRDLLDPASTTFAFGATDNISSSGSGAGGSGANSGASSQYFWHTDDPVYTDAVLSGVSTEPLEDIISDIGSNARIASGAFYIRHYEQSDSSLAMLHAKNIGVQTTGGGTVNIADHNISLTAAHQGNSYTANPDVQLYGGSTVNYAQLSAHDPRLLAIDGANRARMHLLADGSIGVETSTDYGATWGTMLYFGIPLSTAITNISDVLTQTSTQATNWPITAVRYQTWGNVAALSIQVTPTAAKSENYTNTAGTLVSGKRPAVQAGGAGTYTRGGITTGGSIALCAAQAMAANTAYTISFTYLLA